MDLVKAVIGPPKDKCYPASELLYHLLGGKEEGYVPMRGNHHWWLEHRDSKTILDPTAAQYPGGFDYSVGRGGGFLTKHLSQRAVKFQTRLYFMTRGQHRRRLDALDRR
jgi:hypothetical protein